MSYSNIRKNLAGVAIALLLATPATAAPPRLMSRGCLADVVADLSCADSSIMTRCIAIEKVDAELLATCLEAAGCTPDEAENALWITEKCQTGPSSETQPDREGELRRRSLHGQNKRNILKRADSTTTSTDESTTASTTATSTSSSSSETSSSTSTSASTSATSTSSTTGTSTSSSSTTSTSTTSSASATSTSSSSSSVNIGLSSAIVGTTLAIAAVAAFGGVLICAWREGAAKRKAKRESAQKEALLGNMS